MTLIFLDTETTSLDRYTRQVWDVAYIIRKANEQIHRQFFIYVNIADADPASLKIGHYYERHPDPFRYGNLELSGREGAVKTPSEAARIIAEDFQGAILVGAVPSFDEETLAKLLHDKGLVPTWHYHLIDIECMAAAQLRAKPPWNFDTLLAAYGLEYDERDRHTAKGDAVMVMKLYDAVMSKTVEVQELSGKVHKLAVEVQDTDG